MLHQKIRAYFDSIDHRVKALVALLVILLLGGILQNSVPSQAAPLVNGSNAINVLGQFNEDLSTPTITYTKSGAYDSANRRGIADPRAMSVDTVNHRFFLADENNNRVLVYNLNNDNTFVDRLPDFVLGQPDFATRGVVGATQTNIGFPYGLDYDSTNNRLFVADRGWHRVLVYDTTSITNGEAAINVIGQSTFTGLSAATTATGMNTPYDVVYDSANQRLFVSQGLSNRVTVYNLADGITNGEAAVNVLGQPDFVTSTAATTQTVMSRPMGLDYDPGTQRLFVAEENNHRLTVWDVNAITDGEPAANVLGKPDFTTISGTVSSTVMNNVRSVTFDGVHNRLFAVQSSSAGKVYVFNLADGLSDGEAAVNVLGKAAFNSGSDVVPSQTNLNPSEVEYDPSLDRLYVTDFSSRVMVFDVASITNTEPAVDVIGRSTGLTPLNPQPEYTRTGANDGPNEYGFSSPQDVALDSAHHRLFVTDGSPRVVVYNLNADNTFPDRLIDNVLGQPNVYTSTPATTQGSLANNPQSIFYDSPNDRLFVTDTFNHRVLVYDTASITNGENAVAVLGKSDFTTSGAQNTQAGMNLPYDVLYDSVSQRLFVAHFNANRVTVYDLSDGITNGENAIAVLGQPDYVTTTANLTQTGMSQPNGLGLDTTSNRLFVSLGNQHRVLVYNLADGITNGEGAENVLGQTDFTSNTATTTQTSTREPRSIYMDNATRRLFVSQGNNANRITVFDVATITNNEPAVGFLGTPSYTDSANGLPASQSRTRFQTGLYYEPIARILYVADSANNRVMMFDAGPPPGLTVTQSGGTTAVTEGGATDSFTVVLNSEPLTDVVLNVSSNDTTSATVDQATLTFTNANWSTPQTITVTAPQDADVVSETPTITISVNDAASDNDYDPLADSTVNVTVTDNDTAGFSITESGGTTAVTEGGATDTFDVVLTAQPSSNVVFDVSSNDTTSATVNLATLTFTNGNWSTPQTITVTAPQDSDVISETPTITVAVNDPGSDNAWDPLASQTVNVAVTDNDTAGFSITQSGGTTAVTEGGATDTFDVVLTAQPATDVVLSVVSNDTTSATVNLATLTFTNGNWNTPQTITVTAPEDPDAVSETPVITVAVVDGSSDNNWDPLADQTVSVAVTDNDTPGFTITQSGGTTAVTEGGATDSFTVVLTAQPTTDVVIDISSNDTTAATVDLATLTFTNVNWATPQTITVTAPEDPDGVSETPVITVAVNDAGSDNAWDPLADQTVNVAVTDNDTPNISIVESGGSTAVAEGGATDSFTAVLTVQPTTDVVLNVSSNDTSAATVSAATLTFTNSNWATPQTITVTAPQDADIISETPTITVSVDDPSSDNLFDPITDKTVNVAVTDNDSAGFSVTQSGGTTAVMEGGATDTFEVVLTAQPSSVVVFDVSSNDTTSATVNNATLTFTLIDWNIPQTVTVTAPQDSNMVSETPVITVTVNDPASDNTWDPLASQTVNVSVTDDDTPGFTISQSSGTTAVTEGGATDTFDVVLTAQPSSDVVLDVSSNDTSAATVAPATLTFTNGNWNTPKTITVTAPEDVNTVSETSVVTISVNDAASDDGYDPVADATVNVSVTDNDVVVATAPPLFSGGGGGFSAPASTGNSNSNALRSAANENGNDNQNDNDNSTVDNDNQNETGSGSAMGGGGSFGGGNNSGGSSGGSSGTGGGGGAPSVPVIPTDTRNYVAVINERCSGDVLNGNVVETLSAENAQGSITRGELVKILVNCKNVVLAPEYMPVFTDVLKEHPYAAYIYEALNMEIIQGYPDMTFRPDTAITREEAMKVIILAQFNGVAQAFLAIDTPFSDVDVDEWYARFVSFALSRGFVTGYLNVDGTPKNVFGVGNNITRAEAAKVIVNVFGL